MLLSRDYIGFTTSAYLMLQPALLHFKVSSFFNGIRDYFTHIEVYESKPRLYISIRFWKPIITSKFGSDLGIQYLLPTFGSDFRNQYWLPIFGSDFRFWFQVPEFGSGSGFNICFWTRVVILDLIFASRYMIWIQGLHFEIRFKLSWYNYVIWCNEEYQTFTRV